MKDGARLFAYTTWVVMISLAIIVFSNPLLIYVVETDWIGLAALLAYGFIYLNFTYLAVKRFVRKVLGESRLHYLLGFLILLPPFVWILFIRDDILQSSPMILIILAIACIMGSFYGERAGKREQTEHLERLKRKAAQQQSESQK